MSDLTLQQVVLRLCAMLVLAVVHGITVTATASALGDPGPRHDGRLRLNPFVQVDLLGLLSCVLFSIGWSKPVAIDPNTMRMGRGGLPVVVMAATAATLLFALLLRLARPWLLPLLGDTSSTIAFVLIDTIGQLGAWFALINLLPVPPLTGAHILAAVAPGWRGATQRYQLPAALVLLAIAATGILTSALAPVQRVVAGFILGQ